MADATSRSELGATPALSGTNSLVTNLIRAFPFHEETGSTTEDIANSGKLADIDASVAWNTGGGLQFDRTVGDHVQCQDGIGTAYDFMIEGGVGAWTAFIVFAWDGDTGSSDEYTLLDTATGINISNAWTLGFSDSSVEDTNEHNIAIAVDATDGRSFLDGTKKTTDASGAPSVLECCLIRYDAAANAWEIWAAGIDAAHDNMEPMFGGTGNKTSDRWDGSIELVLLFDAKLSDANIASLASNPWQVFEAGVGGGSVVPSIMQSMHQFSGGAL